MKKVSIITVNYNDAVGLRATAESIVCQARYEEIEWIVIDGGSNDGSVDVIHEYADKISYWVSEPDGGIYHAMNKGIAQASGEYLLFRNSGDMMYSSDVIAKFIDHESFGRVDYCSGLNEIHDQKGWFRDSHAPEKVTLATFFRQGVSHPATFIRRTRFESCQYDEKLRIASDMKFFFIDLVLKNASYAVLPFCVCRFSYGGISTSYQLSTTEVNTYLQENLHPRVYADYTRLFRNNPKCEQVLINLIFNRTWELKLVSILASLVCYPRYAWKCCKNKWRRFMVQMGIGR